MFFRKFTVHCSLSWLRWWYSDVQGRTNSQKRTRSRIVITSQSGQCGLWPVTPVKVDIIPIAVFNYASWRLQDAFHAFTSNKLGPQLVGSSRSSNLRGDRLIGWICPPTCECNICHLSRTSMPRSILPIIHLITTQLWHHEEVFDSEESQRKQSGKLNKQLPPASEQSYKSWIRCGSFSYLYSIFVLQGIYSSTFVLL